MRAIQAHKELVDDKSNTFLCESYRGRRGRRQLNVRRDENIVDVIFLRRL